MRYLKTFAAGLVATLLAFAPIAALAQSNPGLTKGQVLTAGQWNALFAGKQDVLGYTPLNVAGGVLTGRLVTAPPGATTSGLNLTPGTTPASPANGDVWITSSGFFARVNGVTIGPLSGGSSASFSNTSPITLSFPSGVVTYACPTCGVTGSPLSQFAATTSAQLRGVISDETGGAGLLVFNINPTLAAVTISGAITSSSASFSGTFGGTPTFSGANFVTLANIEQNTTAWSLIGNASGSTANNAPFTIGGLTSKASIAGTDLIMIQDQAASGAFKRVTVSQVSAGATVASIDAKTGLFTTSNGIDTNVNVIQLTAARRTLPTITPFLTGSGTYNTPANVLWIEIELIGAGSGGAGGNGTASTLGGNTCWNTSGAACTTPVYQAGGGAAAPAAGSSAVGAVGGTVSGSGSCNVLSVSGGNGDSATLSVVGANAAKGGMGGSSSIGGNGGGGNNSTGVGSNAKPNSGSGGGGGGQGSPTSAQGGSGGAAGATCRVIINGPAASYTYAVGAGGNGGTGGSSGASGGDGASGHIVVIEHYGT